MRIWIDLANSPHVPFFRPLAAEFQRREHQVSVTARAFAETVELANAAGFEPQVIGGHGGGNISGKAGNLVQRALALARWARGQNFELAVSHNSYSQILAARALGLKTVTLMDYEHQPANHLAFRFASRIIVPRDFPQTALDRYGAAPARVKRYDGIKEDVYLADFQSDAKFEAELKQLGVAATDVLVTARPPATEALYHRFENELFDSMIVRLLSMPEIKVILLPRNPTQREAYATRAGVNLIVPSKPLDGPNLIACSDLVVSAGGTMNREAAALGVPAASIYLGAWGAIDEALVKSGRLRKISTKADVVNLQVQKKSPTAARRNIGVRSEVTNLILGA